MSTPTTTFTWAVGTMDRQPSKRCCANRALHRYCNDGTYESGVYGSVGLDRLNLIPI